MLNLCTLSYDSIGNTEKKDLLKQLKASLIQQIYGRVIYIQPVFYVKVAKLYY